MNTEPRECLLSMPQEVKGRVHEKKTERDGGKEGGRERQWEKVPPI